MRSVVVVFPASMCAEMPMFRQRSMGVARATVPVLLTPSGRVLRRSLPAVVREGLVGLRHAMGVLALPHGSAAILRGIHQFMSETKRHGLLAAVAGSLE